jgi:Flp pilus assembly pilin Flp
LQESRKPAEAIYVRSSFSTIAAVLVGDLAELWENESGQDMVEYSLLLAFIALAAVGLLSGIKSSVKGIWSTISSTLTSASTAAS